jgi:hypothetical protein
MLTNQIVYYCLISNYIQKADVARVVAEKSKPKFTSVTLKRKVGYTENDDSDEEERMVRNLNL